MLPETTMAFPYDTSNDLNAPSAPVLFTQEPDDFSVFLQQFLFGAPTPSRNAEPVDEELPYPGRISGPEQAPVVNQPGLPLNVSSSPVGTFENDTDEYDGESEEGVEALVGEVAEKQTQKKNSKRSRAAEVHNLSEKRRRSKINEKMKALQKLIPNSNKTDKASMLDEAIEYLKQLQLQVQMLTLRNGLNLYPVCLPAGMLQPDQVPQMTLDMFESNKTVNMSLAKPVPANQNLSADNLVSFQEKPVAAYPTGVGSRAESSTQNRFAPFQLQGIGREEVLPRQHFMEGYPGAGMTALTMMAGNGVVTSNAKAA